MIGGYGAHCNTESLGFNHERSGAFQGTTQSRCPRLRNVVFAHGTAEALPPS
jgi:hypothetical protein